MDNQILSLYAKGMTTREIVATFKEMYDADVSPTLISMIRISSCYAAYG
ncbi:transposase [Acinetobacter baumannii]